MKKRGRWALGRCGILPALVMAMTLPLAERAGAAPIFTVDFDVAISPASHSFILPEGGSANAEYAIAIKNVTVKKDGATLTNWEYIDFVHPNGLNFVPIQYHQEWLPYGGQEFIAFYDDPGYFYAQRVWVTGSMAIQVSNPSGFGTHWENVNGFTGGIRLFAGTDAYDANGTDLQDEGRSKRYYDAYIEHDPMKYRHSSWSDSVFLRINPEVIGVPSSPGDYAFATANVRTSNSLTITAEIVPEPGSVSLTVLAMALLGTVTNVRGLARRHPDRARRSRNV